MIRYAQSTWADEHGHSPISLFLAPSYALSTAMSGQQSWRYELEHGYPGNTHQPSFEMCKNVDRLAIRSPFRVQLSTMLVRKAPIFRTIALWNLILQQPHRTGLASPHSIPQHLASGSAGHMSSCH